MPQAVFQKSSAAVGRTVRFGGLPLPNGQGTLGYINLNDWTSWFLQDVEIDTAQSVQMGQLAWRGRSVLLGVDWPPAVIRLNMEYAEAAAPLGTALAAIVQAGRQYLTFDTATAVPVRFRSVSDRTATVLAPQTPAWAFALEFAAEQQWFQDLTPTTTGTTTLSSGAATLFNLTYAGSVFAEPVWTLTIPVGNTAPIASFTLANTMSGETLTIAFPGNLAASTAYVVTIDSGAFTVADAAGVKYDVTGSFPNLYPPAGQVNPISATLTPASGTATNCTIAASYNPRWTL